MLTIRPCLYFKIFSLTDMNKLYYEQRLTTNANYTLKP